MLDYADPLSSLQSQHVNNLKWLLQRFLTERPPAGTSTANTNTTDDWTEMAHQTLFLLIQCTHATSLQKDTWKLILHALKSPNTQDANDKLRGFMVKTAMDRSDRDFVREWMVHHVYLDRIGEGFSRMEGLLDAYPHVEDPILQGYGGLLCFLLWQRQRASLSKTMAQNWRKDVDSARYFSTASLLLSRSVKLGATDLFINCYVQCLVEDGRANQAQLHLRSFLDENPSNPNALRYLTTLELTHFKYDNRWVPLAESLLHIDPVHSSSSLLQELVDFYDIQSAEDTPSRTEHWLFKIVDLLAKRLDYGIGQSWMWLQLIETIGKMRGKEGSSLDYAVWEERKEWWPRMHFSKAREAYASDQESLVIYAVAAHYIANDAMFYKTFWPLATWIRDMLPLNDSCLSLLEQHGLSVDDICPPVASLFSSSSAASSPVSSIVNTRRSNRSRKRARTTEIDDISDGLDD